MLAISKLRTSLDALIRGDADAEQRERVQAALSSGQITLATGERSAAVGGDANGATFVTGDGSLVLSFPAVDAATVVETIELLRRATVTDPLGLPADLGDYQDRGERQQALLAALSSGERLAAITAIGGMGGIGKTALAVHVANELKDHFPDGVRYIDLQGVAEKPLDPVDAMGRIIRSFDPTAQVPEEPDGAAALYRHMLDGKRALLLLDNAGNGAQVRALLRHRAPETRIIITSRNREITFDGLRRFDLDEMTPDEARVLLRSMLGAERAGDAELDQIATCAGHLPLALRVAGRFLQGHPAWLVSEYVQAVEAVAVELKIEGEPDKDVLAVLGLSASQLEKDDPVLAQRWRQLQVFPADFDRAAAAAVWEHTEAEARARLDTLIARSMLLLDEATRRQRLHDLMRRVAACATQTEDDLASAYARHATHYCKILRHAGDLYASGKQGIIQGLKLYDVEQSNILAGQSWASTNANRSSDIDNLTARWALTIGEQAILKIRLPLDIKIPLFEAQVAASRRIGNRKFEGYSLAKLGDAYATQGEIDRSIQCLEERLKIAIELKDQRGAAKAVLNLGGLHYRMGNVTKSMQMMQMALKMSLAINEIGDAMGALAQIATISSETWESVEKTKILEEVVRFFDQIEPDPWIQTTILCNLASAYMSDRNAEMGKAKCERALEIAREIGDRRGELQAMSVLGWIWVQLGQAERAVELYQQTLVIARDMAIPEDGGNALFGLGKAWAALGDDTKAIGCYEQYLAITEDVGDRLGMKTALRALAESFQDSDDLARSIEYFERYLSITHEMKDRHGEGISRGLLALAHIKLRDWRLAIKHGEEWLTIAREMEGRDREWAALQILGAAHMGLGEVHRAIGHFEQQLGIARETGDRPKESIALGCLAEGYTAVGEIGRTVQHYKLQLPIAREIGDKRYECATLGSLGAAYLSMGDVHRAIEHFEQQLAIARELGDRQVEGATEGYLGIANAHLGEVRRAIGHFEQQLAIVRELGDRRNIGGVLANLGTAHERLGDLDQAIALKRQALAIFEEIDNKQLAAQAKASLTEWTSGGD